MAPPNSKEFLDGLIVLTQFKAATEMQDVPQLSRGFLHPSASRLRVHKGIPCINHLLFESFTPNQVLHFLVGGRHLGLLARALGFRGLGPRPGLCEAELSQKEPNPFISFVTRFEKFLRPGRAVQSLRLWGSMGKIVGLHEPASACPVVALSPSAAVLDPSSSKPSSPEPESLNPETLNPQPATSQGELHRAALCVCFAVGRSAHGHPAPRLKL